MMQFLIKTHTEQIKIAESFMNVCENKKRKPCLAVYMMVEVQQIGFLMALCKSSLDISIA